MVSLPSSSSNQNMLATGPGSAIPVVSSRMQSNLPFFSINISIALTPLSFTEQQRHPFLQPARYQDWTRYPVPTGLYQTGFYNSQISGFHLFQLINHFKMLCCLKEGLRKKKRQTERETDKRERAKSREMDEKRGRERKKERQREREKRERH